MKNQLIATELSIGSWYQIAHEESISYHQATVDFIRAVHLYNTDPENEVFARGLWAEPIPVTHDVLLSAGFYKYVNRNGTYYFHKDIVEVSLLFRGLTLWIRYRSTDISTIDYVHQLQAMVYWMTNLHNKLIFNL